MPSLGIGVRPASSRRPDKPRCVTDCSFANDRLAASNEFMRHLRGLEPLSLFLFLAPVGPIVLRAQVDRTAITGTVTDPQGNRIPRCAVRATESATGFQRETLTTSQGGL